jgi:hypothetical protein
LSAGDFSKDISKARPEILNPFCGIVDRIPTSTAGSGPKTRSMSSTAATNQAIYGDQL